MQPSLDFLIAVIPVRDLAQEVYLFLNHEDQTFDTRNWTNKECIRPTLMPLLTRVFYSQDAKEFARAGILSRIGCEMDRCVFFDPHKELQIITHYTRSYADDPVQPVRARGICLCKNPHYVYVFEKKVARESK